MKSRIMQAALLLLCLMAFVLMGCESDARPRASPLRNTPRDLGILRPGQRAREQAAREQAAREQAAREQAAREQAARELAVQVQAAQELIAQVQAVREQAAREQAAQVQAAQEQVTQEQAVPIQAAPVAAAVPVQASPTQAAPVQMPPAYKVGDTGPAGGIVFYVKDNNSNGWRYLEAAPAGTEQKSRGFHSAEIFHQYKIDDRRLGAGRENTRNFMAFFEQEGDGINTPMWICDSLVVNGFDDWYLPSQEELLCIYYNLYKSGLGDFKTMWYLSSSAAGGTNTAVNFASGRDAERSGGEVAIRAVRQF